MILDANSEARMQLELVLPESWAQGAMVERATRDSKRTVQFSTFAVPELPGTIELAALEPVAPRGDTRGADEVFQNLFARPYGLTALAAYVAERQSRPPEVYGVSQEDTRRMQLVLTEIEHAERNERIQGGVLQIGVGALVAVAGASEYYFNDRLAGQSRSAAHLSGGIDIGLGAIAMLWGGYTLTFSRRAGEKAATDFRTAVSSGVDVTQAFALADARLQQMVARERRGRWVRGILGGVLAVVSGSAIIAYELPRTHASPDDRYDWRIVGGAGVVAGGAMLTSALLIESPVERLTKIWRDDPSLVQLHPMVSASNKGPMFGLAGTF
jgi:hypothetical protein